MSDEWVAVSINNGIIGTVTQCGSDKEYALKVAAYYRSIGYSGKAVTCEKLKEMLDNEAEERRKSEAYLYGISG